MIRLTRRSETDYRFALRLGSALAEYSPDVSVARPGRIVVSVAPLRLLPTAIQLRDKWDFDQVLSVTGIDYPERAELAVVYHIAARFKKNLRHLIVSLETKVPRAEPRVHTLAFVWPSAELHERETHELLGIEFANHPNCGPLLLPEDWEGGYPLRKDFRLRAAEEVER